MNYTTDITFQLFVYGYYADFLPLCVYSTHLCYPKASFSIISREHLPTPTADFLHEFSLGFGISMMINEGIDHIGHRSINHPNERYTIARFLLPRGYHDPSKKFVIIGDVDVLRLPDGGTLYNRHKRFIYDTKKPLSYVCTEVPIDSDGMQWTERGVSGGSVMIEQKRYWPDMEDNIESFIEQDSIPSGPKGNRSIFAPWACDQPALFHLLQDCYGTPDLIDQPDIGVQGLHLGWARPDLQVPLEWPYERMDSAQREWAIMLFDSGIGQECLELVRSSEVHQCLLINQEKLEREP